MSMLEGIARHAPTTSEEVQAVVAAALAAGTRLAVEGGATKRELHAPVNADARLTLSALRGVIDYDHEELVVRVWAGTPLKELEALLAEREQMLAFEPFDHAVWFDRPEGQATVGGIVAANVSGPRRLVSGAARDHLLGFTAVSGRGEILKGGGAVVKNVSGFDLPKLMAGSHGTLAVLTSLTLRVVPRPPTEITLRYRDLEDDEAHRLMTQALGTPAAVSSAAHRPAAMRDEVSAPSVRGAETWLRLEGFGPSVDARARLLERALAAFGRADVLEAADSARAWRAVSALEGLPRRAGAWWRIGVPPAHGAKIRAALAGVAATYRYDWGGGLVWVALREGDVAVERRLIEAARALGGHARRVRPIPPGAPPLPAPARAGDGDAAPTATPLEALHRRVKAAFDPQGILNPGLDLARDL
jgi:glycolate oxidase FAD binding subunit